MKAIKVMHKVCLWILAVFFLLMALGSIPSYGTVLIMLFLAIAVMPIPFISRIWEKLPVRWVLKPIIILTVFLGAILLYEPTDMQTNIGESQEEDIKEDTLGVSENSGVFIAESVSEEKTEKEPTDTLLEESKDTQQAQKEGQSTAAESPEVMMESNKGVIAEEQETAELLEVHFIDVGQGDAILITCGEDTMLIDAGDNSKGTTVQKYLMQQGVESLDYVIMTHPDADHIGGMDVIVYKYDCGIIFMPDAEKDTESYQEVLDVMESKCYSRIVPKVGDVYTLGNASFQILSPALSYAETNNNSIVIRLLHGDNSFLFTGDAEVQAQQEMAYGGYELKSDVMKIPHHGGKSSYQRWFYNEVQPTYAVISCGKDNSYGHPHQEVLEALKEQGVLVYRTDEQGSIIATSDGKEISFNTTPSITWKSGVVDEERDANITSNQITDNNEVYEPEEQQEHMKPEQQGAYAVNGRNGKIHKVGECPATGSGKGAMKEPIYFDTYEEAEEKSIEIDKGLEKRKCGNCW